MATEVTRNAKLRINVLSGFSVELPDGQLLSIANRKACALLAYLCLAQSSIESRERLAGLFWSDRGEEQARASLRQSLKHLRIVFESVGFEGFKTERQDVSLAADTFAVDLREIDGELAAGRVPPRLADGAAKPDEVLYGFEGLDQSFTAWLYVIRQNWHDRVVDALQAILRDPGSTREKVRRAAEALVQIDPTHEEAYRCLIRYHADDGNTSGALRQYNALWDLLDKEYDVEPADETAELIAEIKSGSYRPKSKPVQEVAERHAEALPANTGQFGLPARLPTIGIWDFIRAGPWQQDNYLIDGFRRELIASLVRFREWVVIDGEPAPTAEGVSEIEIHTGRTPISYQLEGAYFEESGSVRLVMTLKDAITRRYIWSEQLNLTIESWFSIQQVIVRRISVALNVYLSVEHLTRIAGRPDVSLDVYDRWLRGQELVLQWRPDAHTQAREMFGSIIEETPGFSRGYSSLVQVENAAPLVNPGLHRSPEKNEAVLELAKQAVRSDPLDSRAQLCLAWAYAIADQHDHAEINFGLACELNQNDPWTMVSAALGWAFCDRAPTALALAQHALSLDLNPSRSHWGYQATIHFMCGEYQDCVTAVERAEEALYNLPAWKASALYHLGRKSEASVEAKKFLSLIRDHWTSPADPEDETIADWLLQCFPIRSEESWCQFRDGLQGAGVSMPPSAMEGPRHSC